MKGKLTVESLSYNIKRNIKMISIAAIVVCTTVAVNAQAFERDPSFSTSYPFNNVRSGLIEQVIQLPNNKLLLVGDFPKESYYIEHIRMAFMELNGDFIYDLPESYQAITLRTRLFNNLIYFSELGTFQRIDTLGFYDAVFDSFLDSSEVQFATQDFLFLNDSSLLIAGLVIGDGVFDQYWEKAEIGKFTPEFVYDTTWRHDADYIISDLYHYDETRVLLEGKFINYYDESQTPNYVSIPSGITRIFNNGNIDTSFNLSILDPNYSGGRRMQVLPDGKIMVFGNFNFFSDSPYFYSKKCFMVRFLSNGEIDTSFHILRDMKFNSIYHPYVATIQPLQDGGYIIGGCFDSIQGYQRGCIAVLDSNGILNQDYFTNGGADSAYTFWSTDVRGVYEISPTEDDKYYVCGRFSRFEGELCGPIIRLFGESYLDTETFELDEIKPKIYPNPAVDVIHIQDLSFGQPAIRYEIFDNIGKLIISGYLHNSSESINIKSLDPGHYFIQFSSNSFSYSLSFVKG